MNRTPMKAVSIGTALAAALLVLSPLRASAQAGAIPDKRVSIAASAGVWSRGLGTWRLGSISVARHIGDLVSVTGSLTSARGENEGCPPSLASECTRHFTHATVGVRVVPNQRIAPFSGLYAGWGWGGLGRIVTGVEVGLQIGITQRLGLTAQVARELLIDAEPEGGSRAEGGLFLRL